MRHFCAAASLFPTHALAEVCDKVVGEHWRSGDPPVWTIPPSDDLPRALTNRPSLSLLFIVVTPLVFALTALAVRADSAGYATFLVATLLKWASYAGVALIAIGAFIALHTIIAPDEIMLAAAREGCIILRSDWLGRSIEIGIVASIVLLYVWTAYRMQRFECAATARYRSRERRRNS